MFANAGSLFTIKMPSKKTFDARAANLEKINHAIAVLGETFGQNYLTVMAWFRRNDAVHDSCTAKFDGRLPTNLWSLAGDANCDLLLSIALADLAMGQLDRLVELFEALLAASKDPKHELMMSLGKV